MTIFEKMKFISEKTGCELLSTNQSLVKFQIYFNVYNLCSVINLEKYSKIKLLRDKYPKNACLSNLTKDNYKILLINLIYKILKDESN
jgi:hypothetical protein